MHVSREVTNLVAQGVFGGSAGSNQFAELAPLETSRALPWEVSPPGFMFIAASWWQVLCLLQLHPCVHP